MAGPDRPAQLPFYLEKGQKLAFIIIPSLLVPWLKTTTVCLRWKTRIRHEIELITIQKLQRIQLSIEYTTEKKSLH